MTQPPTHIVIIDISKQFTATKSRRSPKGLGNYSNLPRIIFGQITNRDAPGDITPKVLQYTPYVFMYIYIIYIYFKQLQVRIR